MEEWGFKDHFFYVRTIPISFPSLGYLPQPSVKSGTCSWQLDQLEEICCFSRENHRQWALWTRATSREKRLRPEKTWTQDPTIFPVAGTNQGSNHWAIWRPKHLIAGREINDRSPSGSMADERSKNEMWDLSTGQTKSPLLTILKALVCESRAKHRRD